jgi:NAD(P)H-hydrate epimerase
MRTIPSLTPAQMARIDRIADKTFNISSLQLMENAGRAVAGLVRNAFNLPKTVAVLAGKGNNGGDGLVAARHLHNRGVEASVVLADKDLKGLPLRQLRAVKALGIRPDKNVKERPDLIIDALLGYGASGPPRGRVAELIVQAQGIGAPVLCLDVPSGLDLASGQWFSPAFRGADVVTLGLPKKNMLGNPGIRRLFLADIGIPREAYEELGIRVPVLFAERDYIELTAQHALGI